MILKEYIKEVENVCNILIESINFSEKFDLKNKYDFYLYKSGCRSMEFETKKYWSVAFHFVALG